MCPRQRVHDPIKIHPFLCRSRGTPCRRPLKARRLLRSEARRGHRSATRITQRAASARITHRETGPGHSHFIKIILTDPHSHELTRSRHSVPSGTDTEAANGYNRTKRVTVQKGHVRLRPRATGQQQVHSLTFRYSSSSGKLYSSAKSWSSFWLMSASAAAAAGSKSASSAAGALPAASSCVRSAAAFTI